MTEQEQGILFRDYEEWLGAVSHAEVQNILKGHMEIWPSSALRILYWKELASLWWSAAEVSIRFPDLSRLIAEQGPALAKEALEAIDGDEWIQVVEEWFEDFWDGIETESGVLESKFETIEDRQEAERDDCEDHLKSLISQIVVLGVCRRILGETSRVRAAAESLSRAKEWVKEYTLKAGVRYFEAVQLPALCRLTELDEGQKVFIQEINLLLRKEGLLQKERDFLRQIAEGISKMG